MDKYNLGECKVIIEEISPNSSDVIQIMLEGVATIEGLEEIGYMPESTIITIKSNRIKIVRRKRKS